MGEGLTAEQFKDALPPGMQKSVNPLLMVKINNLLTNPEEMEMLKENLVSYASVLSKGKFTMPQYLNAVRYVGFRVMDCKIGEAYQKTFPDKVLQFQAKGVAAKDIASYSTAYNKSKLVNLIWEQTLVPVYLINAPLLQKAINVQAVLMMTAKSEMVKFQAANAIMTHLKPPETAKVELDVVVDKGSIIDDYEKVISKMVDAQLEMMEKGGDLLQITNAPIKLQETIDI